MKILIVSQYYYPEQFQINEIAPALVSRGHEVTVLTGIPNYPKGDIFEGYEGGKRREETINGVKVIRCDITPRKQDPVHLLLNYYSFVNKGKKKALTLDGDFDVVLCYQLSPVLMIDPAVAYAKKHHVPLICYCLDIWPESAQGMIRMSSGPIYGYIKSLSKKLYAACDEISVTSRPFIDYFADTLGLDRDKMRYIPQHADTGLLDVDMVAEDNGIADFMYAGNMGKGQTLDVLVRAVAELRDRNDFLVHMVGDGSKREELEALVESLGVKDKFIFYGNQKREDMPAFYKKADALIITLRGNNAVGNTMPGKLQVYMTTGKPIFGAINGAANEVIGEAECGRCVAAGDYKGLAGIMADYIDDPEKYAHAGERAREYFKEHFTLETYMDKLEEQIRETVKKYEA